MSDNMNIEATEAMETVEVAETTEIAENTATKYTIDYVLEQIEKLQQQISENSLNFLRYSVNSIYANDVTESTCEDDSESNNGEESRMSSVACVCEIHRERENTLKQMLRFYEKMYDDLKPTSKANNLEKINLMLAHLSDCKTDAAACCIAGELHRLMEE